MWVENRSDELRVGAKDQSNSEIARTPEIALGLALYHNITQVEH